MCQKKSENAFYNGSSKAFVREFKSDSRKNTNMFGQAK